MTVLWFHAQPLRAGLFYQDVSPTNTFWPDGIIPYEFDASSALTAAQKATYLDGLREWELAANLHLVPRVAQTNYLQLRFGFQQGVNTFVLGTPNVLTIDSLRRNQICHEMGHALGLDHENTRPDRDSFISINFANLDSSAAYLYALATNDTMYGDYDFESVMHYGRDLFAIDPSVDVITPKPAYFAKYYYRIGNFASSVGDRAAVAFLYGPPTNALSPIVTNTTDSGFGSLRAAIYYANDHPGTTIGFNIPTNDPGYASGSWTIRPTGEMPPLVANGTVIDGSTQPGFDSHPVVVLDGSALLPEAYSSSGLYLYATNCTVKGLAFNNYSFCGVVLQTISAVSNTIAACHIGCGAHGTNAAPNAYQGVYVALGAQYNLIGGTNPSDRNIISGNAQYGILIIDTNTSGNVVSGNWIGVNRSGALAISNGIAGVGIWGGAHGNVVGTGNVISGNTYGVFISDGNTFRNSVSGNLIGTDTTGTAAIPNEYGVGLFAGTRTNTIGNPRNLVSGNHSYGVVLAGAGTSFNVVQRNYIGSDLAGSNSVPNATGIGLWDAATNNTIGGPPPTGSGNLLSGNTDYGLFLADAGTRSNLVSLNLIGTQADGMGALPNGIGVGIFGGASQNTIFGNTVSGNNGDGILIADAATTENVIQGNNIGTDTTGSITIGNGAEGVAAFGGASSNSLGGVGAGAGNIIGGSAYRAIFIADTNTTGNLVQGNFIGIGADRATPLTNGFEGIAIANGASGNVIGLALDGSGAGNRIAFSSFAGIYVGYFDQLSTTGNTIRGNSIYTNGGLGIDLSGGNEDGAGVTANDFSDGDSGPNHLQNSPVITKAFADPATTTVGGILNTRASRDYLIDVYRNSSADGSGYGAGQDYAGSTTLTTDGSGSGSFNLAVGGNCAGQYFTATATDAATGDTSEFSLALVATNLPPPPQFNPPLALTSSGFVASVSLNLGQEYRVQVTTNLSPNPVPWVDLTNFSASTTNFQFLDSTATNYSIRFYRVVSP